MIRHSPLNAVPMCSSHHVYFTHRPEKWREFIDSFAPGRFETLMALDRDKQGTPLEEVYEEYAEFYKARKDSSWFEWEAGGRK